MADLSRLAGSAPVSQDAPVVTDGTTIQGNGTRQFPLSAPNSPSSPTFERVTTAGGTATLDPNVGVSYVAAQGSPPAFLTINLPDGDSDTPDGFQKTIAFLGAGLVDADFYRLTFTDQAATSQSPMTFNGGGGGAILVWNKVGGFWQGVGTYALQ